jgi:SNF2 family DNA or RNA helicase
MYTQYINRFIHFHATEKVIDRGKNLYNKEKSTLIGLDENADIADFTVQGGHLYRVRIADFKIRNIKASCTCPYDWNILCKHAVASLLHLSDILESQTVAPIPPMPTVKRPNGSTPILVPDWRNLDKISLGLTDHFLIRNQISTSNEIPRIIEANETNLILEVSIIRYYNYFKEHVHFYLEDGEVFCSSNEKYEQPNHFTIAEAYCLMSLIKSHNQELLQYFFDGTFLQKKKELMARFDLSETLDFNAYFRIFLEGNTVYYSLHKKGEGLVSPQSNDYYLKGIKQLGLAYKQTPIESKALRQIGFMLGITDGFNNKKEMSIITIKGQPNKSNTDLATHINYYSDLTPNEICRPNESQQKLINLINEINQIDENPNYDLLHDAQNYDSEESSPSNFVLAQLQGQLNSLQHIFLLLSKEKYVYFNKDKYYFKLQKKSLQKIKIAEPPLEIKIGVKRSQGWLVVRPFFQIDEVKVSLSKRNKSSIGFFNTQIDETMYVHHSLNTCLYLDAFQFPIKTHEKHFDFLFEEVIEPLSHQFQIEIGKEIVPQKQHFPEAERREIYISEENDLLRFDPVVVYSDDQSYYLYNRGNPLERNEDGIHEYKRDEEFENTFLELLARLHPTFQTQKNNRFFYLPFNEVMHQMWFYEFYEQLQKEHIQVFGINELKKFKYSPYKAKVSTSLNSGEDWFEIDIQVQFGNYQIKTSDLKKAIVNKQKFIQLKNGTVGILPEEWLGRFEKYFRNGLVQDEKLKISKLRFNIIDELFENIDHEQILKEIADKKQRLKDIDQIEEVKVPRGIKAKLRSYQKEGLQWLHFLDSMKWGGILADDMGLGKTLQILSFLKLQLKTKDQPALIIVPTTLLFNWENEIYKFAPSLKAYYHYGITRDKSTDHFKNHHIVFTSYGVLVRDIEFLKDFQFSYAILDESQAIKNPLSQRYKAANLIKAKNKFAMTGTPIENSTFDLYAQMNFVNPGFLGDIKSFKEYYSNKIDKDGDVMISGELQKLSKPFILRRTKEKVAPELPEKTEDILYCEMDKEQKSIYEAYRNEYREKILEKIETEGIGKSRLFILEGLLRLRQICDSPSLLNEPKIHSKQSVKIKELLGFISEKTGKHKLLIFSQFVGMLQLIRNELDKHHIDYEYLDGKSSQQQRQSSVNHFQSNDAVRVFLVSLKAGGTGLNLTSADYVFLVDPWWNPAVEEQAIDRTHRIGQDKKVFAYRMICKDTIEEKIIKLQNKKKKIAEDIIQTDENIIKSLQEKDIRELFS